MKIVLIGYMGSGKSAVGKKLATKLKIPFKDLDQEIEIIEEKIIPQIFSEKGEIYFRKAERNMLKAILDSENNLVLATGGGTPCYSDVMNLLVLDKKVITIYLMTTLNTLTNRIFKEKLDRPLISHIKTEATLKEFIAKHLFERSKYYNQASYKVKTDGLSVLGVVEEIIQKVKKDYSKRA